MKHSKSKDGFARAQSPEDADFDNLMSRQENWQDNALAEIFFSRFKTELLEVGIFESVKQARRTEVFSYIEG